MGGKLIYRVFTFLLLLVLTVNLLPCSASLSDGVGVEYISAGSKLGVGYISPSFKLSVNGTTFTKGFVVNGNSFVASTLAQGSLLVAKSSGALQELAKGTDHYTLKVNGNKLAWEALPSNVVVSPGGSNTDFQFNDGGSFSGNGALTFTKASKALTVPADAPLDINSTTVSIADTDISLDGTSTTFTQSSGAMTMYPANGFNMNVRLDGVSDFIVDTSKLIVNNNGNVGVSYVNPLYKLAVNGSAFAKNFTLNGNSFVASTLAQGSLLVAKSSGALQELTKGTDHYALKVNGNKLAWEASTGLSSSNKLSDLASTTSSELAGVISDETGTAGNLVFSNSPTLVTPVLGVASATSIATTGNITSTVGKFGIGTSSPVKALHINGTGLNTNNAEMLLSAKGSKNWTLGVDNGSSLAAFRLANGSNLANDLKFTVLKSGNVGIGYSSPSSKLHVKGTINSNGLILNGNTASIPSLTQGDLLFAKASSTINRLVKGTNHYALKVNGNALAWEAVSSGSSDVDGLSDAKANATDIFVGNGSGATWTTTATYNTGLGIKALTTVNATTGTYNTAVGYNGLVLTSTGDYNVAMGYNAARAVTTSSNVTAIGSFSLLGNTAADSTAVGFKSAYTNTSGASNTALGNSALYSNSTGSRNTALGHYSAYGSSNMDNGTFLGYNAGRTIGAGDNDTFIGYLAANGATTASYSVAVGSNALAFPSTGTRNTAVGYMAGEGTAGSNFSNGTFLGYNTGVALTTGYNNTMIGYGAGLAVTNGNGNILIGHQAGDAITTGSKNIVIGRDIDAPSNTLSGQLTIGNLIYGNGMTATGTTVSSGKVGIKTSTPRADVDVNGATASKVFVNNSFYSLTSASGVTVNWNNGNKQKITLGHNVTFTFTAPTYGAGSFTLILTQDATGSRTVTWPASVKWPLATAPTLSTAPGYVDIISCLYDTVYYCQMSTDFR